MTTRAPRGGTTGKNGEHYDGGQFLPSSERTVKGSTKRTRHSAGKPRKVQVAPFTWVEPPSAFHRAIYRHGGAAITVVRDSTGWIDRDNPALVACPQVSYYQEDPAYYDELVSAFNQGCRWEVYDSEIGGERVGLE
jgi:RNA:NAD 2'-phosphotransferase (TPT1/KptA family)